MGNKPDNPVDNVAVFFAAGLLSAFGATMYAAASPFLVALGRHYGLGEAQQGRALAVFFLGFTVVAVSISLLKRPVSWRTSGLASVVLGAIAIAGFAFVQGFPTILFAMLIAGVGMGGAYTVAMTVFGSSSNPERALGIKLCLETIPGMALLFLIPGLDSTWGMPGVITSICTLAVLAALATRFIPGAGIARVGETNELSNRKYSKSALWGCIACLVHITGTVGLWSFLAQVASSKGLADQPTAAILSVAYAAVGGGSLLAAFIGTRWGRLWPLTLGCIAYALIGAGVGFVNALVEYGVTVLTWSVLGGFTLVYLIGFVAENDPTGRVVALVSGAFSAGAIVGPLICGEIFERAGSTAMAIFAGAQILLAVSIYLMARPRNVTVRSADEHLVG